MLSLYYKLYQLFGKFYKKSLYKALNRKLDRTKKKNIKGSRIYDRINRVENAVRIFRKNPIKPPVRDKVTIIELQHEIHKENRKLG